MGVPVRAKVIVTTIVSYNVVWPNQKPVCDPNCARDL